MDNDYTEKIMELVHYLRESLEKPYMGKVGLSKMRLRTICDLLSTDKDYSRSYYIIEQYLSRIKNRLELLESDPSDSKKKYLLIRAIVNCYNYLINNRKDSSEYNTEDYYKNLISELQEKETRLKKELSESKQTNEENDELRKQLEIITEQKEQYEAEKDELKKRLNAQENLKDKISDAFKELQKHIKHLKVEKIRLNGMFFFYAILCFCVLGLLMYFEYKYLLRWVDIKSDNIKLIDYLPFYIPVPIVGGLLWVFIYQMNRAQRQLMVVANVLYHVDYIEGLLLAINKISPNVTAASEKISQVLDNLIKNYISMPNEQFERSLDTEISKDSINIDTFIDLAKKVKDVIK